MARVLIALNEVVRNHMYQLEYVYNRYKPNGIEINIEDNPPVTYDLVKYFPFSGGTDALIKFEYEECALEVFGHAGVIGNNTINFINEYAMKLGDYSDHKISIVSREAARSIPATFFFLSKTGCMINDIHFVSKYADEWNYADILVTACPKVLDCKPEGKIAIKINATYNKDSKADYTYDSVLDFINDATVQNKILTLTKIKQNETNKLSGNWWREILRKLRGA